MPELAPLHITWTGKRLVLERDAQQVSITAEEFDEICHWAMHEGLLPILAAEVRTLREWTN